MSCCANLPAPGPDFIAWGNGHMSAYRAEDGFSITVAARGIQRFAEYISFKYIKQEKRLGAGRGLSTDMGGLKRKT